MDRISIIIPAKPGEEPFRSIESLKKADYPRDLMEVIICRGWFPSKQRNLAVKSASARIVYFLDDDSEIPPDTLTKIVKRFREFNMDVLGGPSISPPDDSFIQQCFAQCFASPFGGFNIRHRHKKSGRFRKATERELISCNLAIRRDVYLKEGGLNETLYPNEENEFLDRLHSKGYGLYYDPELFVYRSHRKSFIEFFKQIFTYGRGRMEQTFVNPVFIKIYHFVPLAFVVYLVLLPFLRIQYFKFPFLLYLLLSVIFSSIVAMSKRSWLYLFVMPLVFFLCHTAYGFGSLWGLIKKILPLKRNVPSDKIEIEVVKI